MDETRKRKQEKKAGADKCRRLLLSSGVIAMA
jgi:hypothetical protein